MMRADYFQIISLDCTQGWWVCRTKCVERHALANVELLQGGAAPSDYEALESLHRMMDIHIREHAQGMYGVE